MSNNLKKLAQRVIDNYERGLSGGDDEQFDALIELGNAAREIVRLCTPTEPGPDNVDAIGNLAVFRYQIEADSGYRGEAVHSGITSAQYGDIVAILHRQGYLVRNPA